MPIVVNSNVAATNASFNLSHANDALRKSLARLSSGNRIVNPADDAGGMAVAYKLNSALKRTEAVNHNVQNGISYLQVQDGIRKYLLTICMNQVILLQHILIQTQTENTLKEVELILRKKYRVLTCTTMYLLLI